MNGDGPGREALSVCLLACDEERLVLQAQDRSRTADSWISAYWPFGR